MIRYTLHITCYALRVMRYVLRDRNSISDPNFNFKYFNSQIIYLNLLHLLHLYHLLHNSITH